MDLSKLNLPNSITHFTLVGDNATNIEHIEHYHQAGESASTKCLSEEAENQLADKIEECFKPTEGKSSYDWAVEFIRHISGTNNRKVTDTVREWSSDPKNRIIPNMKTWSILGKPLYDAGLYTGKTEESAESNWNQRMKK